MSVNETGSVKMRFSHPVTVPMIWQNLSHHEGNGTELQKIEEVLKFTIICALDIDEDLCQIAFFNLTSLGL